MGRAALGRCCSSAKTGERVVHRAGFIRLGRVCQHNRAQGVGIDQKRLAKMVPVRRSSEQVAHGSEQEVRLLPPLWQHDQKIENFQILRNSMRKHLAAAGGMNAVNALIAERH